MKILIINKFLHPNGGSETYIFGVGRALQEMGCEVQFFGMAHEKRAVGNRVGAYTGSMDFHGGSRLARLTYPVKTIYSSEARKKLRLVLEDFAPDVCHLNNFNFQLTPSILLEIDKWRRETGHACRIVFTAHDYQLVCPNHMCRNPRTGENCERCLSGNYAPCISGRCIHGSLAKSAVGAAEGWFWRINGAYRFIDRMICCSEFMKTKLDVNPLFAEKTVALHNFIDVPAQLTVQKKDYVLYFGRFSEEKGIGTLIEACKKLPDIPFVFAGAGPLAERMAGVGNIENVGFRSGEALQTLIAGARLSVCPSEWYENCPFSVMESQAYGTPVLGARIGGIPELIAEGETGELFESGSAAELTVRLRALWDDRERLDTYAKNCANPRFDTAKTYCEKLMEIYRGA